MAPQEGFAHIPRAATGITKASSAATSAVEAASALVGRGGLPPSICRLVLGFVRSHTLEQQNQEVLRAALYEISSRELRHPELLECHRLASSGLRTVQEMIDLRKLVSTVEN